MSSYFLHATIAWATLGLISIPIIIHLINRRRFRRMDWAAMEFLLEALKRNRRRIRLEQLILLLLRIALMALIGLFLARPILSDRGFEWLAGLLRSEEKILLLDDSFSTSRKQAGRTTFQRAVEAAETQVRRLGERGGRDRLTIVRGSRHRAPSARGIFVDRTGAEELAQRFSSFTPTDDRLPLADALVSIGEESGQGLGDGVPRPRSILIFTDLRATDWTDGQRGPDEALHSALRNVMGNQDTPTRITLLDVGSEDTTNVAITDVSVEGGRPTKDISTDLRVEIRNLGPVAARGMGLRVRFAPAPGLAGEESAASATIGPVVRDLGPRESAVYTIPCTFRSAEHYGVMVELTGANDPLPGDNSYPLALEVFSGTDVLIVSGQTSSERFEGEADFLEWALAPSGDELSGVRPTVVVEDNLPLTGLEKYAVIFVCNLGSFPAEFLAPLARYVRAGGTLAIFPGDQVKPALYNHQIGKPASDSAADPPAPGSKGAEGQAAGPEKGLLPARIGDEMGNPESPLSILPAFDHPYFRLLRGAEDILSTVHFYRHYALQPLSTAQVVARFSDADGSPAIVEHAVEKGSVILFASAADLDWNDWARNPSYLMVIQELVQTAARTRSERTEHTAGVPIEIPVDIALYSREARLRTPGFPSQPELTLTASPAPPSPEEAAEKDPQPRFRFVIEDTHRAGLYAIALKAKAGTEEWRQLAVRRDPAESNMTRISAAELGDLYPDVEIDVVKDTGAFADVGRGRFEISDFLLWAFVALLFLEGFLALKFAHHRRKTGEGGSRGGPA